MNSKHLEMDVITSVLTSNPRLDIKARREYGLEKPWHVSRSDIAVFLVPFMTNLGQCG